MKQHVCEDCGKSFRANRGLEMHRKRWCGGAGDDVAQVEEKVVTPAEAKEMLKDTTPERFDELSGLKSQAEDMLGHLGHVPGPWADQKGWSHLDCVRCRRRCAVALHPPPGLPKVSGEAATVACQ